jgi:hypothetical protein
VNTTGCTLAIDSIATRVHCFFDGVWAVIGRSERAVVRENWILERRVRQACVVLNIRRRGVHGFRATAACEFVNVKSALGYTDIAARHELAMWLGYNPQRTEVTYAYVPKRSVRFLGGDG